MEWLQFMLTVSDNMDGAKGCRFKTMAKGHGPDTEWRMTMTTRLARFTQRGKSLWRTQTGSRMV